MYHLGGAVSFQVESVMHGYAVVYRFRRRTYATKVLTKAAFRSDLLVKPKGYRVEVLGKGCCMRIHTISIVRDGRHLAR